MGSLTTAEGRRAARLTRVTGTGDDNGTVEDDDTTQSRIAFNIREERRVLDRLRAAQPPPVTLDSLDFPETGGSTLMGDGGHAYYNEPLVRLASTTEAGNDDDSAIDGGTTQGTVEGSHTLTTTAETMGGVTGIPRRPMMCINHERCRRASRTQRDPVFCCDECEESNGYEHEDHCRLTTITESQREW